MASGLLDVLDKWDLIDSGARVESFTMQDLRDLAEDLQSAYRVVSPILGGCHIGLHESIMIVEGRASLAGLAFPLVTNEIVLLPDPIYSFISRNAAKLWHMTFEAGGNFYGKPSGPRMPWRSVWDYPASERRIQLRKQLPALLDVVRLMRPLVESNAIRFFPWEQLAYADPATVKAALDSLNANQLTTAASQKYRQGEYTLGPRVGSIDISAKDDFEDHRVKKGDLFHFVDKGPLILNALANLAVSGVTGAIYNPGKRGDRLMTEFLTTGGTTVPDLRPLSSEARVPNLGEALWPDIVEIRKQSETAAELRRVFDSLDEYQGPEASIPDVLAEQLIRVGERLQADASLSRARKASLTNMSVDAVMTGGGLGLGAALLGTGTATGAAIALGAVPVKNFLNKLFDRERRARRRRADLLIRVGTRLAG